MNRRKAGFTVMELLMVMASVVVLALLWAIFLRPRGNVDYFDRIMTKSQVNRLTQACNGYVRMFDDVYPGVLPDNKVGTNGTGGTPANISGCQNLRLSLLGCSRTGGNAYREEDRGPADDMDNYLGNNQWTGNPTRIYRTFYTADKDELRAHGDQGCPTYGNASGYDTSPPIRVLVSYRMPQPRPLLYYRATAAGTFNYNDNAVYCDASQKEGPGDFAASGSVARAVADKSPFLIISAGYDGKYFTADDIDSTDK